MRPTLIESKLTEYPSMRSHSDMPTMLGVPLRSGVPLDAGSCCMLPLDMLLSAGLTGRRRLSILAIASCETISAISSAGMPRIFLPRKTSALLR